MKAKTYASKMIRNNKISIDKVEKLNEIMHRENLLGDMQHLMFMPLGGFVAIQETPSHKIWDEGSKNITYKFNAKEFVIAVSCELNVLNLKNLL